MVKMNAQLNSMFGMASRGNVRNEYVPNTITAIISMLTSTGLSTEILKMDMGFLLGLVIGYW